MAEDRAPAGPVARVSGRGIEQGARALLPLAVMVVPWGLAFGAAARERGLATAEILLMSATVFAGASQFAALDVWTRPLPWLSIALVVFVVNARHLVMGAALSPFVNPLPLGRRMMVLSVMTDANFAVAQTELRSGRTDAGFVFGGGLVLYLAWLLGTALGAVVGNAFAPLDRFGIDVTLGAFFGAIVVSQIAAERWRLLPVACACAVAFLAADALPAGWSIVLAAIVGGAVAAVRHDA